MMQPGQEYAGLSPEQQAILEALLAQNSGDASAGALSSPQEITPPPGVPEISLDPFAAQAGMFGPMAETYAPQGEMGSPFMRDLEELTQGALRAPGQAADAIGSALAGPANYLTGSDFPTRSRPESETPDDPRTIEELAAALGLQLDSEQNMAPVGFGPERGGRPEMPDFNPSARADFSGAQAQLELMRGLAGEETDFSDMEALVAQLEPEERSKQDRRDTELGGIFEGMANAAGRVGSDTQIGTMLMQLGLGASAGLASGRRENRDEDDAHAARQREYINSQLNLGELRLSNTDARRQQQIAIEAQGMGLSQDEAMAHAATDAANNQMELQVAIAGFDRDMADWSSQGGELLGGIGDDGTVFYQYRDPTTGQMTIASLNLLQESQEAAAAAGGGSGAYAAGLNTRTIPQAASWLIDQWREAGALPEIFEDEYEDIIAESIQSGLGLSAISGTDMDERRGAMQLAHENYLLINLLLQNPELLRVGLSSMVPVSGE